ncbi:MAG: carbamoyl-phosphate synthase large subunit [bacterium]|nr:carbamoyl-phosphate synthase large subunit [bacterium]
MPKRTDINKILLIGSGPIIIGQACEFDYSGTQACKALKEEGYFVILVNSNPATIMTDPSLADRTYIEPLTPEILGKIIEKERPDAVLPTVGGQTALNLAIDLHKLGILEKYNVQMLGACPEVIAKAETRDSFKKAMEKLGLRLPYSEVAYSISEAKNIIQRIGFPAIVRPAFTLGGTGGGIIYNMDELETIAGSGLRHSMISEILIEESIIGWKEYELEVMRDRNDNVVIVCSIENLDPMGVHTGDSITVAPAQTLTDNEYQIMRDAALAIIREIGVETGGSNIQFAVNPENGDLVVIEMNPRVSRSSALASKATGFPIAKFAAKLAVGYTLDELSNDITKKTPACFEPVLDYCVVKIPRFNFDKFPQTRKELGVSMKSVGEAMSIGRTFKEALQKGIRSLETKQFGFGFYNNDLDNIDHSDLIKNLTTPNPDRLRYIKYALEQGMTVEKLISYTKIDLWFLYQMKQLVDFAVEIKGIDFSDEKEKVDYLVQAKKWGFSDKQLINLMGFTDEISVRQFRNKHKVLPVYKLVDTCAAEFEAYTPYYYSTYEVEDESRLSDNRKVMILGGGPNRIGQGIEFDYCCVHASFAVKEEGFESIMVNSNPETVSTDFDISDKLYFEPLTYEDVINIYEREKPLGVIVQFGGQTPLNLSKSLEKSGVNILGTQSDSIDRAEDRERFGALINQLGLKQPDNGIAANSEESLRIAERIGYPVLVRPSYVLGGASMEIVYDSIELANYMKNAADISSERPVLIDKYLEDAIEVDVDAIADGEDCVIAGIMEHIEEAGIHSGDSACAIPPHSLAREVINEIREMTDKLARELKVIGLMNIQYAIKGSVVYILEVNPRGSRTVPFVSKATDIPWAQMATKVILGRKIKDLGLKEVEMKCTAVKESVFPFSRFPGVDILLGPEMKSTGEVMGVDSDFGMAYVKAQLGAGQLIPREGTVFISVKDQDKNKVVPIARKLTNMGFKIIATAGTARALQKASIEASKINKIDEGRPHVADHIKNGDIQIVINTPSGKNPLKDEIIIRQAALSHNIPVVTTVSGAKATVDAVDKYIKRKIEVSALQDK